MGKVEEEGGFNSVFDSIPKSFTFSKLLNFFLLDFSNLTGFKLRKYHQHLSRCLQHNILCCFSRSLPLVLARMMYLLQHYSRQLLSVSHVTAARRLFPGTVGMCSVLIWRAGILINLRCRAVCGPASVQVHGHCGAQDLRALKSS